jgi:hypothetical protein
MKIKPSLTPALVYKGKVYKAHIGGTHLDALHKIPENNLKDPNFDCETVFITHIGKILNRSSALDFAKKHDLLNRYYYSYNGPQLISEHLKDSREESTMYLGTSSYRAAYFLAAGWDHSLPYTSLDDAKLQAAHHTLADGGQPVILKISPTALASDVLSPEFCSLYIVGDNRPLPIRLGLSDLETAGFLGDMLKELLNSLKGAHHHIVHAIKVGKGDTDAGISKTLSDYHGKNTHRKAKGINWGSKSKKSNSKPNSSGPKTPPGSGPKPNPGGPSPGSGPNTSPGSPSPNPGAPPASPPPTNPTAPINPITNRKIITQTIPTRAIIGQKIASGPKKLMNALHFARKSIVHLHQHLQKNASKIATIKPFKQRPLVQKQPKPIKVKPIKPIKVKPIKPTKAPTFDDTASINIVKVRGTIFGLETSTVVNLRKPFALVKNKEGLALKREHGGMEFIVHPDDIGLLQ